MALYTRANDLIVSEQAYYRALVRNHGNYEAKRIWNDILDYNSYTRIPNRSSTYSNNSTEIQKKVEKKVQEVEKPKIVQQLQSEKDRAYHSKLAKEYALTDEYKSKIKEGRARVELVKLEAAKKVVKERAAKLKAEQITKEMKRRATIVIISLIVLGGLIFTIYLYQYY